jgi:hypothetical protein
MQMNSQEYKVVTDILNTLFRNDVITTETYRVLRDKISELIIEHELTK